MPAGGGKAVFLLVWRKKFIQLAVVVRQRPQKIVDLQNGIARRFIRASLAVQVCKGAEIRVAVGVFQRFSQCRPRSSCTVPGSAGAKSGGISSA